MLRIRKLRAYEFSIFPKLTVKPFRIKTRSKISKMTKKWCLSSRLDEIHECDWSSPVGTGMKKWRVGVGYYRIL